MTTETEEKRDQSTQRSGVDLHAPCYADPLEDPKYQEWLEEMAKHCPCTPAYNRPCEGVCAGGLCDDEQWDDAHWEPDDDYA